MRACLVAVGSTQICGGYAESRGGCQLLWSGQAQCLWVHAGGSATALPLVGACGAWWVLWGLWQPDAALQRRRRVARPMYRGWHQLARAISGRVWHERDWRDAPADGACCRVGTAALSQLRTGAKLRPNGSSRAATIGALGTGAPRQPSSCGSAVLHMRSIYRPTARSGADLMAWFKRQRIMTRTAETWEVSTASRMQLSDFATTAGPRRGRAVHSPCHPPYHQHTYPVDATHILAPLTRKNTCSRQPVWPVASPVPVALLRGPPLAQGTATQQAPSLHVVPWAGPHGRNLISPRPPPMFCIMEPLHPGRLQHLCHTPSRLTRPQHHLAFISTLPPPICRLSVVLPASNNASRARC